jgi:hypothetical protein
MMKSGKPDLMRPERVEGAHGLGRDDTKKLITF